MTGLIKVYFRNKNKCFPLILREKLCFLSKEQAHGSVNDMSGHVPAIYPPQRTDTLTVTLTNSWDTNSDTDSKTREETTFQD